MSLALVLLRAGGRSPRLLIVSAIVSSRVRLTWKPTMNDPNTLQEFINLTKGIEYIIALLFLLVFPVFWRLLNKKKDP